MNSVCRSVRVGAVGLALASGWARAATLTVPSGPYPTIQAAIGAAGPSDEVAVSPGTYAESIDFLGKAIAVRSSGGSAVTTIAPPSGPGVRCVNGEGPDSVLEGFTVTGGTGDPTRFIGFTVGGGMYTGDSCSPTVVDCIFTGNQADFGGGIFTGVGSDPVITDCVFDLNDAGSEGGGICAFDGSNPTVVRCLFSGNTAMGMGGGMFHGNGSQSDIVDCVFDSNVANEGGGMANRDSSHPRIVNGVFFGNTSVGNGGGIFNRSGSQPAVINCTFGGNDAGGSGGGMFNRLTAPMVTNCIFWGNTDLGGGGESAQFDELDPLGTHTPIFAYNCIEGGWTGETDKGNIAADPLFVDAVNGDFRLSAGSPCIDAGLSLPTGVDVAGHLRLIDDPTTPDTGIGFPVVVDMGAFEFGALPPTNTPADFDHDGDVDGIDFTLFASCFNGAGRPPRSAGCPQF